MDFAQGGGKARAVGREGRVGLADVLRRGEVLAGAFEEELHRVQKQHAVLGEAFLQEERQEVGGRAAAAAGGRRDGAEPTGSARQEVEPKGVHKATQRDREESLEADQRQLTHLRRTFYTFA